MTRETKIGLLVGLAFIIVIGILLSDHLSVNAEPPQAALVQAGTSVREGITVPGSPTLNQTAAPVNIVPQQTVPTRQDLQPPVQRQEAIVSIQAGGPSMQQAPISIQQHPDSTHLGSLSQANFANPPTQYQLLPQDLIAGSIPPNSSHVNLPTQPEGPPSLMVAGAEPDHRELSRNSNLQQVARQFNEQLVGVNDPGQTAQHSAGSANQSNTVEAREYVATEGDSLSRIAAKHFGRSTKETRELIVKANPSLKDDPNMIIAGRTYLIPQKSVSATPQPVARQQPQPPVRAEQRAALATTYTVKEGDTLWGIARNQCGSASAIQGIKDLNKDVLKGDTVVVGMTLRLPNRTVASVQ